MTRAWIPLVLLLVAAPSARPAAPPAPINAAVSRAIPLLVKGAKGHAKKRSCFACHNQAIPLLALTTARDHGFRVRKEDIREQLEHIASFLGKNRDSFRKGTGTGGRADTAGYALLTLEYGGWKADATTAAVVEYLLSYQSKKDHWSATSTRPPSEASPFTTTFVSLRGISKWGGNKQKKRIDKRISTVRRWLLEAKAKDTEDRVFRLWGLHTAGVKGKPLESAVRELLDTQQKDGGWSQLERMGSDAYATGSALFALNRAGGVAINDKAYQRGLSFLVKSQRTDGSWLVHSRSRPFQAYYESGFPHGEHQFISMSASAWAVAALAVACQ